MNYILSEQHPFRGQVLRSVSPSGGELIRHFHAGIAYIHSLHHIQCKACLANLSRNIFLKKKNSVPLVNNMIRI